MAFHAVVDIVEPDELTFSSSLLLLLFAWSPETKRIKTEKEISYLIYRAKCFSVFTVLSNNTLNTTIRIPLYYTLYVRTLYTGATINSTKIIMVSNPNIKNNLRKSLMLTNMWLLCFIIKTWIVSISDHNDEMNCITEFNNNLQFLTCQNYIL